MRHSGYRHLKPAQPDGHEPSSEGFYIHAFLLFCWFLSSMHWAWVWYSKQREARGKKCEERYGLPVYEIQHRDGAWRDCGDPAGQLLWPGDMSMSKDTGKIQSLW